MTIDRLLVNVLAALDPVEQVGQQTAQELLGHPHAHDALLDVLIAANRSAELQARLGMIQCPCQAGPQPGQVQDSRQEPFQDKHDPENLQTVPEFAQQGVSRQRCLARGQVTGAGRTQASQVSQDVRLDSGSSRLDQEDVDLPARGNVLEPGGNQDQLSRTDIGDATFVGV